MTMKQLFNGMTNRQWRFALRIAEGASYSSALREYYPRSRRWRPKAVWTRASALAHLPAVRKFVADIRRQASEPDQPDALSATPPPPSSSSSPAQPPPAPVDEQEARLARILAWVEEQGVSFHREAFTVALQYDGGNVTGLDAAEVADRWRARHGES